ncbi:DMT family transporter [Singulisphaera acidiphila]|uniref:EamA-like transporter family n=1 Tax=Singulisphaera acidiphila (strain ATCC BAA-1392 / DSM 18658 / VKM B-2454 / MOB10) TaxID=886293 RepID=L0DH99_SINAD|nr:DMT family transporter [Singulisphaera acidiphila]AGA28749.1 EamA-like transporter family [Singulisphaera acidiphila DSM 18658]
MTLTALGLILAAAVLHALWNLLAKQAGGGVILVWLYGMTSAVLLTPLAVALAVLDCPELDTTGLSYTLASVLIHVAYYVVLQRGYKLGDLSLVYPLARGTGPVLSTVAAIFLLGERPTALALLGAILIALSVFALASPSRTATADTKQAVAMGLLTGLLIAAYTICDKQAVSRYGVPPLIQQWGTSVGLAAVLAPLAIRRRAEVRHCWTHHWRAVLAIGLLVPTAYILVLAAMRFTPVSYIAPAREVSILIATLMGTHLLSERQSVTRIAAAATMVLGLAALALG